MARERMTVRPMALKDEPSPVIFDERATSFAGIRDAAVELLAMHDIAPRVVRYVASMQKWLITQAIVALHLNRQADPTCPPLTAGALIDFFARQPIFSKNTLTAHLAEMRAYGLLIVQESTDRRVKPLHLSAYGETLIRKWLESHLAALDRLDGGSRRARFADDPGLLARIHPSAIQSLIFDPAWACPPTSVDLFVRTESGSNILHELICRLPAHLQNGDEPVCLGQLHASEISTRHTLSRGHVQKVFARARSQGLLTWGLPGNQGDLFVSRTLLWDYVRWQEVKFKAISAAYEQA